jgi:hypothetical protein
MYTLTNAQNVGGKKILQRVAGKNASKQFWKYHNEGILKKYKTSLLVGSLDTKPKIEEVAKPAPAAAAPQPTKASTKVVKNTNLEESDALEPFGEQIPFADPSWYQSVSLPILELFQ